MRKFLSILVWAYWTVCFHLCLLITAILFVLTYPFDPLRKIPNWGLMLLGRIMMKPIPTWTFDIRGAEKAKIAEPTLVVANHQSFLDLPLLNLLPWQMKWVTKSSMLNIPVLGWMIRMTGHIPIERQSFRSVGAMHALVKPITHGIPGLIFPEGTRTTDGDLRAFKRGAFTIAKKYNFNVLPIVLKGGYEAMPSGTWQFRFHTTFVISILEPLDPSDFSNAKTMGDAVHQQIQHELDDIRANERKKS